MRSSNAATSIIRPLRRSNLPKPAAELARYLIGKTLVHDHPTGRMSGRIVETEAYEPDDAASHSYRGQSRRNRSMFLDRGYAYVYFIYGNWHCLNVVSGRPGVGAAVLLRALEPLEGIVLMRRRRKGATLENIARGPGRLVTALRIGPEHDGLDLCNGGRLWLGTESKPTGVIARSVRIGLSKEIHRRLRFYERGNPCVSGPKRLNI